MIRALAALVVGAGLMLVLGAGSPGPATRIAADRAVMSRAESALGALDRLEQAIAPALEAARRGGARTVGGDGPPGEAFAEASSRLEAATDEAGAARAALSALDAALLARDPAAEPVGAPFPTGELGSIADQLGAAAPAAEEFAAQRERAHAMLETLEQALVALEAGALDDAASLAAAARTDHAALLAWEVELVTLPVWLDTTEAMISAVEEIVAATRAGDVRAAEAAASAFATLAEEAAPADRALRIAIGEGGSAVAAAPLERLATVLRGIDEAQRAVAAVR